jgi:4-hydroxybenzoyl-CoA thioesterase
MHYSFPQKVLFKHCDPAGIVFYPRIFEMINDAVEAMFCDLLNWPFEAIHREHGVPTAAINVRFRAPCRHGDMLDLQLMINAIGGTSLNLTTRAVTGTVLRFEADQTLVYVDQNGRPTPWPDSIRQRINGLMEGRS